MRVLSTTIRHREAAQQPWRSIFFKRKARMDCHGPAMQALAMTEARGSIFTVIATLLCLLFSMHTSVSASAHVSIVTDSEIETGIRDLIDPVIKAAGMRPDEIKVYVLIDSNVNAFVAGGRNIFINTGLITLFNDPDILRGVVAHELGHISGGHLIRNNAKMREVMSHSIITTLLGVGAIAGGAGDVGMALIFGGAHGIQRTLMSHSRSQESAADQAAVKFLHESGNTVAGLVKLQEYFMKEQLSIEDQINQYAITHPLGKERLSLARVALQQEHGKYAASAKEKQLYGRIVAKLLGFLDQPANNFKIDSKNLDPFARAYQIAIATYRTGDFSSAIKQLDALIAQEPTNGYLYQMKGQFLFEHGKVFESASVYKQAIQYLKDDPIVVAEYALALVNCADLLQDQEKKKNVLNEVIKLLHLATTYDFKNPYVYRSLAVAYGKLGDLGNSNLMLAEEALLYGRTAEAQNFAEKAKRYVKNDAKLQLKIDDVLKTLRNDEISK